MCDHVFLLPNRVPKLERMPAWPDGSPLVDQGSLSSLQGEPRLQENHDACCSRWQSSLSHPNLQTPIAHPDQRPLQLSDLNNSGRSIPLQSLVQHLAHLPHLVHANPHDIHDLARAQRRTASFGQHAQLALRVQGEGECTGGEGRFEVVGVYDGLQAVYQLCTWKKSRVLYTRRHAEPR